MTKAAIGGKGYGWEEGAIDMGIGAVDGASTMIGAKAGTVAAKSVIEASAGSALRKSGAEATERLVTLASKDMLERSTAKRVMTGALEGSVDGVVGGGMSSGTASALRDGTWDQGFGEGIKRVGLDTAMGAGTGAVAGGVVSGGMAARAGGGSHIIDDSKLWQENNMPNNRWRTYSNFDEMTTVNRALEPNPPTLKYTNEFGGEVEVKVYGSSNKAQVDNVRNSVDRMVNVGGDNALMNTSEIHIRNNVGEILDPTTGQRLSGIGGLGGKRSGEMVISAEQASSRHSADHVIHHEIGHNIDASKGTGGRYWGSDDPGSPFGKGASVSSYGAKNATEDFAETHRELIGNWEKIKADPDRYIHYNGDIGKKYQWQLENIYGQKIPPATAPKDYAAKIAAQNPQMAGGGVMGDITAGGSTIGGGMGGMGGMGGGMLGGMNSIPSDKIASFLRTPEGNKTLMAMSPFLKDATPEQLEMAIEQISKNPGMMGGLGSFGGGMTGGMGAFGGAAGNQGGGMMGGGMMGGPAGGFKPLRPQ
jgi:hypothetical protein